MMKQLLIEEMKRAIHLMESKEEIKKYKREKHIGYDNREFILTTVDRETTEIVTLLKSIRRHSILLEKGIKR